MTGQQGWMRVFVVLGMCALAVLGNATSGHTAASRSGADASTTEPIGVSGSSPAAQAAEDTAARQRVAVVGDWSQSAAFAAFLLTFRGSPPRRSTNAISTRKPWPASTRWSLASTR